MLRYVTSRVPLNPVFVETGTYEGDGVVTALSLGFPKVISIEMFEGLYLNCKNKFAGDDRVTILQGDSALILGDAIKDVNEKITFWLDGHIFPEQEFILNVKACPLIEELGLIAKHPIKNHVIMIDDMTSLPVGGVYKTTTFSRYDVEQAVLRINPNYNISYFDRGGTDVLIAVCH